MTRAAVLGAGSWGTTFAKVLADAGSEVTLWARRPELADGDQRRRTRNRDYLPGIELPDASRATDDPAEALDDADVVVLSRSRRRRCATTWPRGRRCCRPTRRCVSLMKGVELGTAKRMSEVIAEVDRRRPPTGSPCCPARTSPARSPQEQPTATVVACVDDGPRRGACSSLPAPPYFRPYTNTDVVGCELGGAVKNVIALACGIAAGHGLRRQHVASLITRGLAETARLGVALGADPLTFAGLAGLGDLVATCNSPLSRNRTFGERLGRGKTLEQAQAATTADRRGRQVVPLGARPGPRATASTCRSPRRWSGSATRASHRTTWCGRS